jgi:hypothetical protein
VDPGGIKTSIPGTPGTWTRYAYVQGDPINLMDLHGLVACDPGNNDTGCAEPVADGGGAPSAAKGDRLI